MVSCNLVLELGEEVDQVILEKYLVLHPAHRNLIEEPICDLKFQLL